MHSVGLQIASAVLSVNLARLLAALIVAKFPYWSHLCNKCYFTQSE